MNFPLVSRRAHDLLVRQVQELKDERRLLIDRLAILGLGGPIFNTPAVEDVTREPAEPDLADPEGEMIAGMMRFRRRPSRFADELTRQAYREYNKRNVGPSVAWVPAAETERVNAALDQAEELGRKMKNGN